MGQVVPSLEDSSPGYPGRQVITLARGAKLGLVVTGSRCAESSLRHRVLCAQVVMDSQLELTTTFCDDPKPQLAGGETVAFGITVV